MEDACSDIRDTCVVGNALRRKRPVLGALREALDSLLYQGIRPSVNPLSRDDAVTRLVDLHCSAHRGEAETLLTTLTPGGGIILEDT